ncbi:hypothetical protein [Vibrio phage vB_VmeM-Yong XC32]|nr:hypothetical protein [Vibrio phage vB_VmeM-Yong XC31]QAX96440.1 hypothetical protein [Vibrio phage vB_VmeM-Yong XC32]QAX96757.1 hypothetical protein [Vibrio phage vB_VmeM-Yong MS31]QAX97076.1 hypothetical protein [Vibrio phage vB_VmeM-Yong MS32]
MSTIALYESTVLQTRNKVGKMAIDANGYREICLGAFNCMSEKGEFYRFTKELEAMFSPSSRLMQQIANGKLHGEVEHPYPVPGMTFGMFVSRVGRVANELVGHHIKSVRLEEGKDDKGNRIIKVFGWVKGSGLYGPQLEKKFDNPEENVDFSIRTLTHPTTYEGGVPNKRIKLIVTWDQVNHGGIAVANKWDTPSMEGIDASNEGIWTPDKDEPIAISEAALFKSEQEAKLLDGIGMEGDDLVTSTMIRSAMGWEKVQLIDPRSSTFW